MSTPDTQDKKVLQFPPFIVQPAATPAESCCIDHAYAAESALVAGALDDACYSWQVDGMDCAVCAHKVETATRQVPGVGQAQVPPATERLLVNTEDGIRAQVESAVHQAGYTLRDVDILVAEKVRGSLLRDSLSLLILIIVMTLSWGLEQANHLIGQLVFTVTTLVGLWPVTRQALRLIESGNWFAIETLMSVATAGALLIGVTAEATMVLLLFLVGERLEGWATSYARQGVNVLMTLKPDTATRLRNGVRETVVQRDPRPGDVTEVVAGGHLPADGQLLSPSISFDESVLTGGPVPVGRQARERVATGTTNVDRLVQLIVISEPGDSAIGHILKLVEGAEECWAPIERFIDRFSRIYTPAIMVVTLLVATVLPLFFTGAWLPWIHKGLTLLLIDCPCALATSTSAATTSGLVAAVCRRALIKGDVALEQLGQVQQVAFDKTGTLTVGQPQVTSVITTAKIDDDALLALAVAVKQGSSYPLAQAIVRGAQRRQLNISPASGQWVLAGSGIEAEVNSSCILICVASEVAPAEHKAQVRQLESVGQTAVPVTRSETLLGILALYDALHDDAHQVVDALHQLGVQGVILTGDNPHTAAVIASELRLESYADLLSAGEAKAVMVLNIGTPLAVVGDGINDALAMKMTTIGIAMGSGIDVALETTDATLTHSCLTGLARMTSLVHATHVSIRQNIAIALGLKGTLLVITLLDLTGLWLAMLVDTGTTMLVTVGALWLSCKKL